jgi:putative redox protein
MPTIEVRSGASFRNEITAGDHTIIADEPEKVGGTNLGPTPYDLLGAALGSCTSMTLHFYAKREKIPLEGVELSITHDRRHAEDCAECLNMSGFIHHFEVTIRLLGDALSQEQKEKLLTIARKCPVAKTLTSQIHISERLAE